MTIWETIGIGLLILICVLLILGLTHHYYKELEIRNRIWRALVSGVLVIMELFL
ncbi:hypothetical protein NRIC_02060 [Enterococcus florum]|uniref:Uncharacterized protein n=1 Tax=Enterococcus florum TaxID=2480627 RepID=A0A4P5P3J5_9ENTE|nr:hypothetical protein [Enterococcus florum]GCF92315.1 hypothetical protein NRIC_02060 [Enterococcus florum]